MLTSLRSALITSQLPRRAHLMLPGTALLSAIGSSPGAEIGEDEQEIILHEERPVISKETVPVERVRIRAERREEDQTVRSEVRKERIEVERGDDDTSRRPS